MGRPAGVVRRGRSGTGAGGRRPYTGTGGRSHRRGADHFVRCRPPRALSPLKLLALAENATLTGQDNEGKVPSWSERWPYPALPAVGLLSAALLAGLAAVRRRAPGLPPGVAPLTAFALGCVLVWLVVKAVILFLIGGVSLPGGEGDMLRLTWVFC